jgi:hypothetical protein
MSFRVGLLVFILMTAVVAPLPPPAAGKDAGDQAAIVQTEQEITWDFETGDLRGWTPSGDAFATQPTYGDNPTARHRGQPSKHAGQYWIGGYENRPNVSDPPGRTQGDGPQGTLTSREFILTSPVISFLIGGGCDPVKERVELLVNGNIHYTMTGKCTETMERRCLNVSALHGKSAQIRLVDASSGGWGHINFDDIHFAGTFDQDVQAVSAAEQCSSTVNLTTEPERAPPGVRKSSGAHRTIRTYRTIRVR